MKRVSIAVVDDHDLCREGIVLVLRQIPEFRVLFDVADGEAFLAKVEDQCPDVVLMDINMPRLDGVAATERALVRHPELKIIALTMFSDHLHYVQMIQAGARGFVPKSSNKAELREAILAVAHGRTFFNRDMFANNVQMHDDQKTPSISKREQEILNCVCRGMTSVEIAEQLCISPKTVEGHRTNLLQKAGVRKTADLVVWAIRQGYLTVD